MTEDVGVVIVGAGQAGLSLSYELSHAGVEHLIIERDRVGDHGVGAGTASVSSRLTGPFSCPAAGTKETTRTDSCREMR